MTGKKYNKIKAVIFDVDGTLTYPISSWEAVHKNLGTWENVGEKYKDDYLDGKISYEKFCELNAKVWKDLTEDYIKGILYDNDKVAYLPAAKAALRTLVERGYKIFLISSGLYYLSERVARECRATHFWANKLDVNITTGKLTGGIENSEIVNEEKKGIFYKKILENSDWNLSPDEIAAVGDTKSDMMGFKDCALRFLVKRPWNSNSLDDEINILENGFEDFIRHFPDIRDPDKEKSHLWTVWLLNALPNSDENFDVHSVQKHIEILKKEGNVWWGVIHPPGYIH